MNSRSVSLSLYVGNTDALQVIAVPHGSPTRVAFGKPSKDAFYVTIESTIPLSHATGRVKSDPSLGGM